jgi:cyanate permease
VPWKKLWLLFTVIWVVVAALNAGTIIAFSEEQEKAWRPILLGIAVPAVLYLIGLAWQWLRRDRSPRT